MYELQAFLLKEKYPEKLIESGIDRAMNFDRNALRNVPEQTYEPVITYVFHSQPSKAWIIQCS